MQQKQDLFNLLRKKPKSKKYEIVIKTGTASDRGRKRQHNEDSWLMQQMDTVSTDGKIHGIYMVADGVGGAAAGEIASRMAVEEVAKEYFTHNMEEPLEILRSAILAANKNINRHAAEKPQYRGMASTLTALVILNERALIAQIGDTRAYLIRDNVIQQLTIDQTVTGDLLAKGLITPEEVQNHPQRHVLLQALGGGGSPPEPVLSELALLPNDIFLLCSDGLYNLVNNEEIKSVALKTEPQLAAASLVNLANDRGGTDNITVIIIKNEKKLRSRSIFNLLSARLKKAFAVAT